MNMRLYGAVLAVVLAVGGTKEAAAELFRCQLADRVVSYQQTPCAVPELPQPERPPVAAPQPKPVTAPAQKPLARPEVDAASAKPVAAPMAAAPKSFWSGPDDSAAKLTRHQREVLDLTARLERCRADQPDFADRSGPLYDAWRRRHDKTLSEHRRLLAQKVRVARRGDAVSCSDEWLRELELLARTPDGRFSTVERTWEVFVNALQAADRATLLACVSGPAAGRMKERIERMADADLRRMGVSIRGLKVQWGDDYEKEGLVVHGERVDGIAFRRVNEEWKIGNLYATGALPVTPRRSSPDS